MGWFPLFAPSFLWSDVKIGGGGYQRDMTIHTDGTIVTQTDVYGGYIGSTTLNQVWQQLVTNISLPSSFSASTNPYQQGGFAALAIAPSNSSIIVGLYTPFLTQNGVVFISQNKGATWINGQIGAIQVTANIGVIPQACQPRIAIDPLNPNICFVGTETTGLWKTTNLLSNPPTWTQMTANSFPTTTSAPGVVSMQFDPTSGSGGATQRLIVGVTGSGIWVTANAGTSWAQIALSTTTPARGTIGSDGTYYVTNQAASSLSRLSTGNVLADITPPSGNVFQLIVDPNNPARGIASGNGTAFNVATSAINSGTPTWYGINDNSYTAGGYHKLNAAAGQPQWTLGSANPSGYGDRFLSDGGAQFDPFLITPTSVSQTIGNGSFSFTIPAGEPISVGDCVRAFSAANPSNFISGYVNSYSGTTLTFFVANTTSATTITMAAGSQTLTVGAGLNFVLSSRIEIFETSNNFNVMSGTVTSYSGTTLIINVTDYQGSGTHSDWTIQQGTFGGSGTASDWKLMKDRIWTSMGTGIIYTDNPLSFGSQQWQVQFTGLESLVANQVVWPPVVGSNPFAACWDRPFWNLVDPDTYEGGYHPAYVSFGSGQPVIFGSSVDWAKSNPSPPFLVGLAADGANNYSGFSNDGGVSWTPFTTIPPGQSGPNGGGGCIVAIDTNRIVICKNNDLGIFQTQNGGSTWTQATGAPLTGWGSNPNNSSNYRITADCVTLGNVYAFNDSGAGANSGIWKSTDGGQSFTQTWASGAFSPDPLFSALIRAVPNIGSTPTAGHIFLTLGTGNDQSPPHPVNLPFYRWTNGGVGAPTTVANVLEVLTFGFGAPKPGNSYPAIYIVGWVSQDGGITYKYGIWRSDDNASSWNFMVDFPPRNNIDTGGGGWIDLVTTIEGNPNRWNSCIVGFTGSSFVRYGPSKGW